MALRLSRSLLLLLVCLSAGCVQNLPPEVKPAAAAAEVLLRVQELQNTVIALYDQTPRGITPERAAMINSFCVSAARSLREVPAGWQATVKASWMELKGRMPTPTDTKLSVIWTIVDKMMEAL